MGFRRAKHIDGGESAPQPTATTTAEKGSEPDTERLPRAGWTKGRVIGTGLGAFLLLGASVGSTLALSSDGPDTRSGRTEGALSEIKLPITPPEGKHAPRTADVAKRGRIIKWLCEKRDITIVLALEKDPASGVLSAVAESNPRDLNGLPLRLEPKDRFALATEQDTQTFQQMMEGTPGANGAKEIPGACDLAPEPN